LHWTAATIRIPEKPFLNLSQVAAAVNYTRKELNTMIAHGKFPPGRFIAGRKGRRWSAMTVAAFLLWQEFGPEGTEGTGGITGESPPLVKGSRPEKSGAKVG
jgi:predicted DNA-binding transcriptional regulator AlpA